MSFLTSACDLPQKLQSVSWVGRAIGFWMIGRSGQGKDCPSDSSFGLLFQRFFVLVKAGYLLSRLDHLIHQAVSLGVFSGHESVAVRVLGERFAGLAAVFGQNFVDPVFQATDFLRLNADVRGLALHAA